MRFLIPLLFVLFALRVDDAVAADTSGDPSDPENNTNLWWPVINKGSTNSWWPKSDPGDETNTWGPEDAEDRRFLGKILDALKKKDIAWIADHMNYPISIEWDGKKKIVNTRDEFLPIAKQRFTDYVCAGIADDAKTPLFKNWQGTMVGRGSVWFSQYGTNENGPWTYEIDAIGYFAGQPPESDTPVPLTDAEKQFLGQILVAIKKKDMAWIANHIVYPITIYTDGKHQDVSTIEEFIPIAKRMLSDDVCARIADAARKPLSEDWDEGGVMVGDDILWFGQYSDDKKGLRKFGIGGIGGFAIQVGDRFQ